MNIKKCEKEKWINVGKFTAILAVLGDHTAGILYDNLKIIPVFYFATSLFVILMGITSYWSFQRSTISQCKKIIDRILKILFFYSIAVFLYLYIETGGHSWSEYFFYLVRFNASMPLYYVFLYCQLVIISPLLFLLIQKTERKYGGGYEVCLCVIIIVLALLSTKYTRIGSIYGGGGKVAGGTYAICLLVGMLIGKHNKKIKMVKSNYVFFVLFLFITFVVTCLIYFTGTIFDPFIYFGNGINPPGMLLIFHAFSIMGVLYFGSKALEQLNWKILIFLEEKMAILGSYTLYIFLYHRLFIDYLLVQPVSNNLVFAVLYLSIMIAGSIVIGKFTGVIGTIIQKLYKQILKGTK